jgi:hypothetical protein
MTLTARGEITGDAANTVAFLINASTLDARSSQSGQIRLQATGNLDVLHLLTQQGSIELTVAGNLIARDVNAAAQAVALRTPLATTVTRDANNLPLRDITSGQIVGGVVTLEAGTALRQIDTTPVAGSGIVANQLTLRSNEASALVNLNVSALDAQVLRAGALALTMIGTGTTAVDHLETLDGTITVNSSRSLDLRQIIAGRSASRTPTLATGDANNNNKLDLDELPQDISIVSSGKIQGLGAGTHVAVDAAAGGAIELRAGTGIDALRVNVAELRNVVSTQGGVSITDASPATRSLLQLTHIESSNGDVSVSSNVALDVAYVHAAAATASLQLQSTGSDLLVRSTALGGNVVAGSRVVLDAAQNLTIDPSVWIDASDSVTFRAGRTFTVPTAQYYLAPTLKVYSGESIVVNDELRVDKNGSAAAERVEMLSARDILSLIHI